MQFKMDSVTRKLHQATRLSCEGNERASGDETRVGPKFLDPPLPVRSSFPDPSHGEEGSGNIAIPKLFLRNAISG